jgi:hypothetical protein
MSEPDIEIQQCPLAPERSLQKRAWVAVDDQGNALSVFAALQISLDDPLRMKDCALYTTPSWRGKGLAKRLFLRARDDLAAETPPVVLEWSTIATPVGYQVARSLEFRISDEHAAELGANLDKRLAENPDDERLRSYAALRDEHGGRLPYDPFNQDKADQEGRKALHDAAEALQLRVIEEQ